MYGVLWIQSSVPDKLLPLLWDFRRKTENYYVLDGGPSMKGPSEHIDYEVWVATISYYMYVRVSEYLD